jgi:hypothetical protein
MTPLSLMAHDLVTDGFRRCLDAPGANELALM